MREDFRRRRCVVLAAAALAAVLSASQARADRYVRAGAPIGGAGSDWTNAYPSLPATLVRGETYWIAAGSYAPYRFDDPASGDVYIRIKKATASEHGSDAGWDGAYGAGPAIFAGDVTVLDFRTPYWIFDGSTRVSATSGHGFVVRMTNTASGPVYGIHFNTEAASHITVSHTEVHHPSPCPLVEASIRQDTVRTSGADAITLQRNYLHDAPTNLVMGAGGDDWLVEHNYFENSHTNASNHGQAIYTGLPYSRNWTIRHNVFKNINGSAVIFMSTLVEDFSIYGNVFWEEAGSAACGAYSTNYVIDTNSSSTANNIRFFNNTIVDIDGRSAGSGGLSYDAGTGNTAYNNLWYGAATPGAAFNNVAHDYNAFSGPDAFGEANAQTGAPSALFTSYAGGDFRLAGATAAGNASIGAGHDLDPDDVRRGADGSWDRGAFEYIGHGGTLPAPDPPQGLSIR